MITLMVQSVDTTAAYKTFVFIAFSLFCVHRDQQSIVPFHPVAYKALTSQVSSCWQQSSRQCAEMPQWGRLSQITLF